MRSSWCKRWVGPWGLALCPPEFPFSLFLQLRLFLSSPRPAVKKRQGLYRKVKDVRELTSLSRSSGSALPEGFLYHGELPPLFTGSPEQYSDWSGAFAIWVAIFIALIDLMLDLLALYLETEAKEAPRVFFSLDWVRKLLLKEINAIRPMELLSVWVRLADPRAIHVHLDLVRDHGAFVSE